MNNHRKLFLLLVLLTACSVLAHAQAIVTKAPFGTADGQSVDLYTLRNVHGVEARITNYGGILVSLKVPDRNGKFDDVVLGINDLDSY